MNSKNSNVQEKAECATAMSKEVSEERVINKEMKRIVTVEELKKFVEHQKTLVSTYLKTLEEYLNYLKERVEGSSSYSYRERESLPCPVKEESISWTFGDWCLEEAAECITEFLDGCARNEDEVEFEEGCDEIWKDYQKWLAPYYFDEYTETYNYLTSIGFTETDSRYEWRVRIAEFEKIEEEEDEIDEDE